MSNCSGGACTRVFTTTALLAQIYCLSLITLSLFNTKTLLIPGAAPLDPRHIKPSCRGVTFTRVITTAALLSLMYCLFCYSLLALSLPLNNKQVCSLGRRPRTFATS